MSASTHRYTCEQLGVCQDRVPRCSKCKSSEGTRTAEAILGNNPESLDEFYRYPRTLEQAFGPGQRDLNDGPHPMPRADRFVMRVSGLATAAMVAVLLTACGTATRCPEPYGCNAGKAGFVSSAGKPTENNGGSLGGGAKPGPAGTAGPGTGSPGAGNPGTGGPGAGNPGAGNPGGGKAPGKGHGGHGKGGKGHGGKGGKK